MERDEILRRFEQHLDRALANIRRLAEIKSGVQRIADPRKTSEADARRLIANLPAVIWLICPMPLDMFTMRP